MIRYYGLYARNKKKRVYKIIKGLGRYNVEREQYLDDKLKRLDAMICEMCGSQVEMVEK